MFATVAGAYPSVSRREGVRTALEDQLDAALGMVTDGRIYGGGYTRKQVVDAWREADALVRDLTTPGLEPPLVKACVLGPYSFARMEGAGPEGPAWGPAGPSKARERRTMGRAEAVAATARLLFEAGAAVVQVQEDALALVGDEVSERALAKTALQRVANGAEGHLSLAVCGGNADTAGADLFFDQAFSSYLFDLILGPDNWRLIAQAPSDRGIICGVADARTAVPDHEAVMIWAARYATVLGGRGIERVGLAPSAGLEALPREVARLKLKALAQAASRAGLADAELATSIDPRAVDARSAGLGRVEPPVRRRPGSDRRARR